MNNKKTLEEINEKAKNPSDFIAECSQAYRRSVYSAAQSIVRDKSIKIVLLAGPSSSGKTTTAKFLSEALGSLGSRGYTVSLDDFYFPHSVGYPLDENGKPDYECVEALDLELLHSKLYELAEKRSADLPVFEFKSGERLNNAKKIELRENDVIIVEGLHALNPVITDNLSEENLHKIYVSVSSRVYDESGEVLLSKRDLRFIRRMVRDFRFRSTGVERTFEIWHSVTRGEDRYLFPFEYRADVKLNSFHSCEPCVFANEAIRLLSDVCKKEHTEKAERLISTLSLFEKTDYSLLPANSLLREFTG